MTLLVVLILVLCIVAMAMVFALGMKKLIPPSREVVCLCVGVKCEASEKVLSCRTYSDRLANYWERRNGFVCNMGQVFIVIVIVGLLVILLLLGKISPESALPIIAGLGGFGVGKSIANARRGSPPDQTTNQPPPR
ncbi:MAG: hypothetical protein FWB78_12735 [Treponema sp.]|nr:hypothetical protein [Treponema sp.]